jgi:hypothetical protein
MANLCSVSINNGLKNNINQLKISSHPADRVLKCFFHADWTIAQLSSVIVYSHN